MTVADQIQALPADAYVGIWDGAEYDHPIKTDELIALAESHERMLKVCHEMLEYDYYPPELEEAVRQAGRN